MYIQVALSGCPSPPFFLNVNRTFLLFVHVKKIEKYSNILNKLTPPQVLVIKIILDLQIISKIQDNCPPPPTLVKVFSYWMFSFLFLFWPVKMYKPKE